MTTTRVAFATRPDLDEDACWTLLRGAHLGRLAVRAADGVDIFPVNYLVDGRSLVFRSAPGTKLIDLTAEPRVAFEVDGVDATHRWSVVVRGRARRLADDEEIELSGIADLATATPTAKHSYVRILPGAVTGRRFRWTGDA
jgi:nitroimidazol reductase NimA-like FMN-containing flavoprotein (pyridoxamine 5'-phosphate oxidase superfamily)